MKNVVLIIGARPNFMKAFPVYEALKEDFDLTLKEEEIELIDEINMQNENKNSETPK